MGNFKPKCWLYISIYQYQVYHNVLNELTLKFNTMSGTWNTVPRCNTMTSVQIQNGGWTPYWESVFGSTWATYCPINVKFGVRKQNYMMTKIQDGERPLSWRWFFLFISAANHPISTKFGKQTRIMISRLVSWRRIKIFQTKMADGRHIENRFRLYLRAILSDEREIRSEEAELHSETVTSRPKCQISKMQDDGRPPLWKWLYLYISEANCPISMTFGVQVRSFIRVIDTWTILQF